jgi:DNA-binding transcriptional LysR family regulator
MTRPQQGQLVMRRVGRIELGLHATKDYLAAHGTPRNTGELADHALIGYGHATAFIRNADKGMQGFQRRAFSFATDSDLAQLALIRSGAGIGICQTALAERSGLVRVLSKAFSIPMETWVTMHEDLRNSPRCRAAFDALAEELTRYAA